MVNRKELLDGFDSLIGTRSRTNYTRIYHDLTITGGVKYLVDSIDCKWLMDLIYSWQTDVLIMSNSLQIYTLIKVKDYRILTCEDSNGNILKFQKIEHRCIPLDILTLYYQYQNILLPLEY